MIKNKKVVNSVTIAHKTTFQTNQKKLYLTTQQQHNKSQNVS